MLATAPAVQTCRYCARREFVKKVHGNNRVWRCVLTDDIIATTDPACRDYDHYDAREGRHRMRSPRFIVLPEPAIEPTPKPMPKYHAGDSCPRCGTRLLSNYGSVECLQCGTLEDAEPWMPSPSGNVFPPRGVVDPFGY